MQPSQSLQFRVIPSTSRPTSSRPVLFTHTLCPYAERASLALLEKGVAFDLCHIDLSAKPSWYRQVNPRGLVPAVQHQGHVQVESLDICRWVDSQFEGPPLLPSDPQLRAEVERLVAGVDAFVSAGLDLMAGRTGRYWGIGGGQSSSQQAAFEAQLRPLQEALQRHGGPFLAGAAPSLADIAAYPFARRFAVGMPELCGYDVRAALGGSIAGWLDSMGERESGSITSADDALLLKAYRRHKCLDFFDYDSYSVFELHPHNSRFLE